MDMQNIGVETLYSPNEWQREVAAESKYGNREARGKNLDPKRFFLDDRSGSYRLVEQ